MKNPLRFLAFILLVGSVCAQSKLPACHSTGFYHQCFVAYTTENGDKYIGEWGDSKVSKDGIFTSSSGNKFVEKFNGNGIATFKDGHKFIGEFKDGKPNGQGTLFESNGSVINQGIWASGSFLSSAFQDPSYIGQGTYSRNGNKYVGTWRDGKYNGQGTFTFFSGSKYVGEFKDNQFSGQGTLFSPSELVVVTGVWANGKFVRSDSLQRSSLAESNSSNCAKPEYPSFSRRLEEEGSVEVLFLVEADGKVNAAAVEKSSGFRRLDEAATRGVSTCQFKPLIVGGVTQQSWASMKFTFRLETNTAQSNVPIAQTANATNVSASLGALPACLGDKTATWNNCLGTFTYFYGAKDVNEYQNGMRNGQGIEYDKNGSVISAGTWKNNQQVSSHAVDKTKVPFNLQAISTTNNQSANDISKAERDRLTAEVEAERKKRYELEQQLAAAKDREQITSELDLERKKRQELEAQLAASVQPAQPQSNAPRRIAHALVIGNGAYPGSGRLDNPVNDANAISQKLRSMGFIVTTVTDANRQRLVQSMAQFRRTAASADISLLYYAGHGVQIFGTNYILPTDVDQTDPAQATIQGVSLNSVVENFLPGKTKLVFLDACRDNALQRTNDRSVSKGLAPISAAEGTLISYATKDGQTAADGVGSKNSPFTQALLEHLNDPQDIAVVLRKVRERVMKITGGKQQPWEYGSLTGGELVLSAIKPK
jgi:TonB family protein